MSKEDDINTMTDLLLKASERYSRGNDKTLRLRSEILLRTYLGIAKILSDEGAALYPDFAINACRKLISKAVKHTDALQLELFDLEDLTAGCRRRAKL